MAVVEANDESNAAAVVALDVVAAKPDAKPHASASPATLQQVWDATAAGLKAQFIESNAAELRRLLADYGRKANAAALERAAVTPAVSAPLAAPSPAPDPWADLDIPDYLRRVN